MDSLKGEISGDIAIMVKSGFYDKEEILQQISDMYEEYDLDEKWVEKEIREQYNHQLSVQKTWPKETDFDRLAQVFDQLNRSGIVSLHNAGTTKQDGEADTREIHEELKSKGIKTKGYCFYHTQDMERALDGADLYLAFGDFEADDKFGTDIGKYVVAALHAAGFKTRWNESIETRIEVVGLKWQKRFGNGNCSYERAILLLQQKK